jgi:predicted Zn-ribbon and HTH transcriptional regulator
MSKFDETLFGRIAVLNNYLSWDQLEESLQIQRTESPPRRLGEILVDRGYLTQEQLRMILEIRRKKIRKLLRDPQEARESDKDFGELALRAGHITLDGLETAILEQERLSRLGLHFRLGEILVAKALMQVSDVLEILRRQGKRIMLCPMCDCHFNVLGFKAGRAYRCLKCQTDLLEPKFLDTVAVDAFIEG